MADDIAWSRALIALARLLNELRGGAGAVGPTRRPVRRDRSRGGPWPVSWRRRSMGGALILHVPPVLLAPIAREQPVLRLLCSHVAAGTVVKKCAWSY
jgi:hypothetical protein